MQAIEVWTTQSPALIRELVPTSRQFTASWPTTVAKQGPILKDGDLKAKIAYKLRSKKGLAIYFQRKAIVEPVNGQIKEGRGLIRFVLRGLETVGGEWGT